MPGRKKRLAQRRTNDAPQERANFIENYLPGQNYHVARGVSRGAQNLVFYYREPVSVISIDADFSYYDPWQDDVDADGLTEYLRWERKPLEVVLGLGTGDIKLHSLPTPSSTIPLEFSTGSGSIIFWYPRI